MKKYLYLILIAIIISIFGIFIIKSFRHDSLPAYNDTSILLDYDKLNLSAQCIYDGNYVLAPAEDISKSLGANPDKKTANSIQIIKGDTVILLTVNSKEAQVDGKVDMLPVPVKKSKGIIMAPISYLANKLGATTAYDNVTRTIFLNTVGNGAIVFLGDSLTANFNLQKYFNKVINKGNNGDTSFGVIGRLNQVILLKPKKLFIMVGTNDVWGKIAPDMTMANYRHIINIMKMSSPGTEIIIQSILPMGTAALDKNPDASNEKIDSLNKQLQTMAKELNLNFIDIGSLYKDGSNRLDTVYSSDGIHINDKSYKIWADAISEFVI